MENTQENTFSKQGQPGKQPEHIPVNLTPISEIYETLKEDILKRGTEPKYKTGLRELDEMIWGLHKKEVLVIGARTSHGKSAFAMQVAANIADADNRVVYLSLEMSKEQIVERMLCNFGKINNKLLRRGLGKFHVETKGNTFEKWVTDLKFLIDDKYGYHFDRIVEICDIITPDFLFIDYIQMISTKGYKSKLEAVEEYVRKLKQLSVERNIGIIILSQLNRESADVSKPLMHTLKWAGVLEEHSDAVILLHWVNEGGEYKLFVSKQRHGEVGELKLIFQPQYYLFTDR